MGTPLIRSKALLLAGVLYTQESRYDEALRDLEAHLGGAVMETPPLPWDYSAYYRNEMGAPLYRKFVFFRELIEQDALAPIKLFTNRIEQKFTSEGRRSVNLDPGYLTPAKLVLASTKDFSHRIYLKDGIFAEVTLMYERGKFIPHKNTYRDYIDERFQRYFYLARNLLQILSSADTEQAQKK
ncbi:MAG: DUF4416 family protein [Alphaproteobacteria bacterium]|uniref:DUF4416 family protein n=1 Tax=Candidatus Nitrobium versatile TaxID=2884831 RepID=A0A953M3A4_9BACT|nr:DUF4416 family protein [Candidatus Nitrobium versatile]